VKVELGAHATEMAKQTTSPLQRARRRGTTHSPLAKNDEFDEHGVGLILDPVTLVVEGLLPGSSASESRLVQAGDILTKVGGEPVQDFEDVKDKILGPTGTHVLISFARVSAQGTRVMSLDLMRGPAPYIALAHEVAILEEENHRLTQQLAGRKPEAPAQPAPPPPREKDPTIESLRRQLQNCMTQLQYKNDIIASLEEQLGTSHGVTAVPRASRERNSSPSRVAFDNMAAEMENNVQQLIRSRDQGHSGWAPASLEQQYTSAKSDHRYPQRGYR